jgi:hypothetical protein
MVDKPMKIPGPDARRVRIEATRHKATRASRVPATTHAVERGVVGRWRPPAAGGVMSRR